MVTLALDTSHAVGSVAVARDGVLLGTEQFTEPSAHLVALGHALDHVLGTAGLAPTGLDRLAVVTGPGSFTGLRIGLSFAKGLHAATGVDIVAINALHLLALPWLKDNARVCAMIDARRGEVYAAVYERAAPDEILQDASAARVTMPPQADSPSHWLASLAGPPDVFVGTGAHAHRESLQAQFPGATIADGDAMCPSTAHLAVIAHAMRALDENAVRTLEPLYVRASGAERLRAHARRTESADG